MIPGHATAGGSVRYRDRFPQLREAGHFRFPEHVPGANDISLSSIGLGTYLGEPSDAADHEYTEAIALALSSGINVLDTAINYRHQRSERNIGAALKKLVDSGELKRDEVLVCSKAGYLSFDDAVPADARGYFVREYIEPGILDPKQLVGGMHCMAPAYLENQIERSRRNLGLETIDVYYVHNPESQLADIPREAFYQRLLDAFTMMEEQVRLRRIEFYGMATWNGLRIAEGSRDYLGLADIVDSASKAGGEGHHFRFVQLPFNLGMPEAFGLLNQRVGNKKVSLFNAAAELGVAVIGSATLHQGQLTHGLPDFLGKILGLKTDAENAIQFSRSAPRITTALVGMGHKEHVVDNLKPARIPPSPREEWTKLFRRAS
jgi:aryl-alcohol dehydrogenase-like predicted oxidoreductase